ncbi:MAG TPA: S8/S53 family peptidase [Mycobacteriales bacterium]
MPPADAREWPLPPGSRSRRRSFHRENQIIVDTADVGTVRQRLGAQIVRTDSSQLGVTRLTLRPGTDVPQQVRTLRAVLGPPGPNRRLAGANCVLQPWVSPGGDSGPRPDPGPLITSTDQGAAVTVLVPDSALVANFAALLPPQRASAEPPNRLTPTGGATTSTARHGTFVASILLSAAVLPRVVVHDVFNGADGTDDWELAIAIARYLGPPEAPTARLVSLSCGAFADDPPPALTALVARYPKVVWVAAAGNVDPENDDDAVRPAWPAKLPTVIGVGATDSAGVKADFTDPLSADVWAPGVLSTGVFGAGSVNGVTFDRFALWSGTSFATPVVAAKLTAVVADGAGGAGSVFDRAMEFLRQEYSRGPDIVVI